MVLMTGVMAVLGPRPSKRVECKGGPPLPESLPVSD